MTDPVELAKRLVDEVVKTATATRTLAERLRASRRRHHAMREILKIHVSRLRLLRHAHALGARLYPFDEKSVLAYAPRQSGVFALFSDAACLYVGESSDLRSQLMQHLKDKDGGLAFSYECVPAMSRSRRCAELTIELRPVYPPGLG